MITAALRLTTLFARFCLRGQDHPRNISDPMPGCDKPGLSVEILRLIGEWLREQVLIIPTAARSSTSALNSTGADLMTSMYQMTVKRMLAGRQFSYPVVNYDRVFVLRKVDLPLSTALPIYPTGLVMYGCLLALVFLARIASEIANRMTSTRPDNTTKSQFTQIPRYDCKNPVSKPARFGTLLRSMSDHPISNLTFPLYRTGRSMTEKAMNLSTHSGTNQNRATATISRTNGSRKQPIRFHQSNPQPIPIYQSNEQPTIFHQSKHQPIIFHQSNQQPIRIRQYRPLITMGDAIRIAFGQSLNVKQRTFTLMLIMMCFAAFTNVLQGELLPMMIIGEFSCVDCKKPAERPEIGTKMQEKTKNC